MASGTGIGGFFQVLGDYFHHTIGGFVAMHTGGAAQIGEAAGIGGFSNVNLTISQHYAQAYNLYSGQGGFTSLDLSIFFGSVDIEQTRARSSSGIVTLEQALRNAATVAPLGFTTFSVVFPH